MSDTAISTRVYVLDGATATEIARAQAAIDRMVADIDDILTSRVDIEFLSEAGMIAHGDTLPGGDAAWGYSHTSARKVHINDSLTSIQTQYTILHEVGGHFGDDDTLNPTRRTAVTALMSPDSSGLGWKEGPSKTRPAEVSADTFARAYSDLTYDPGYYTTKIRAADYAAYRTAYGVSGAGSGGDSTDPPPTGGGEVFSYTVDILNNATRSQLISGRALRETGNWRVRTYDAQGAGTWSAWVTYALKVTPNKPSQLVPVNGSVTTLSPVFGAKLSSSDPTDYVTRYAIRVYQDLASGSSVLKMDVDETQDGTATVISVPYTGNVGGDLSPGQRYRWFVRLYNRDGMADQTDWSYFTAESALVGATVSPNNTDDKIDTLTPTFRLSGSTNIDQARLRLYANDGTSLLYDSGVIEFSTAAYRDVVIPSGYLDWGMNPKVQGAVRLTGDLNLGPYSDLFTVHINAKPGSPSPGTLEQLTGEQTIQRSDGVWVTTTESPVIVFPFRDVDRDLGYTDDPERREIELRDDVDAHAGASPYVITVGITDEWTVPASVLDIEATYKTRARYDDSADVRSEFSTYTYVKYSEAPTLSSVTPVANDTITDPTPTFAWTFASSSGKTQASYRLQARAAEAVVYDSDVVTSTDGEITLPPLILPNDTLIDWTLTVYDSDGLYATESRQFTTDFSVPAALTGLTVSEDVEEKALRLTVDQSALPDDEFLAYNFYAKVEGGQFELIASIDEQTTPSIYYRAAPHNREVLIRVTQTNGYAESEPIEELAMLGGEPDFIGGYWDVGTDGAYELLFVTQNGPGDTQTRIEQYTPLGATQKTLLNWGTSRYEGGYSLYTDDRDLLNRLRRYKETGEVRLFKTWYGESRYVRYTSTPDTDQPAAMANGSVSYVSVDPASTNF